MISINAFCTICKLKKIRFFAVSIRDLKYQVEKKAKLETNPKNIIPEKYYNFLNIFLKKNSDTHSFYQKYDNKIILEKE